MNGEQLMGVYRTWILSYYCALDAERDVQKSIVNCTAALLVRYKDSRLHMVLMKVIVNPCRAVDVIRALESSLRKDGYL